MLLLFLGQLMQYYVHKLTVVYIFCTKPPKNSTNKRWEIFFIQIRKVKKKMHRMFIEIKIQTPNCVLVWRTWCWKKGTVDAFRRSELAFNYIWSKNGMLGPFMVACLLYLIPLWCKNPLSTEIVCDFASV